jgi:hypothetical protein
VCKGQTNLFFSAAKVTQSLVTLDCTGYQINLALEPYVISMFLFVLYYYFIFVLSLSTGIEFAFELDLKCWLHELLNVDFENLDWYILEFQWHITC